MAIRQAIRRRRDGVLRGPGRAEISPAGRPPSKGNDAVGCTAVGAPDLGRLKVASAASGRGGNTDRIRPRWNASSNASRRNARRSVPCSRLATRHYSQTCDYC